MCHRYYRQWWGHHHPSTSLGIRDSADLRQGIPSREILPTLAACLMKKCKYLKHFFFDVNLNLLRNFNLSDCVWETTCCHVKHESSHYQQPAGCSYLVKSKSHIQNLLSHFTVFPLCPGSPPCWSPASACCQCPPPPPCAGCAGHTSDSASVPSRAEHSTPGTGPRTPWTEAFPRTP